MQFPILQGIYTDQNSDYRIKYPHNMMPVQLDTGINRGYLRPAYGVSYFDVQDQAFNVDKGSINWNDRCIRVIGDYLVEIFADGTISTISTLSGTTIGNDPVSMDYSFDYLAIADGGNLYIWDGGTTLTQNTDPDLGLVLDVIFIDGYFMTTDGSYLVITDLGNPLSVNSLKYGSSEVDPDPIVGLLKIHNEVYALNRYTIEAFYNKGGALFPFARIDGSRIMRGLIGTHAKCELEGQIIFLGSGRNESPAIWRGANSESSKISTREIDSILQTYTENELKTVVIEKLVDRNNQQIWVRLPDKILIYDDVASRSIQQPVWFSIDYGPKNLCWAYDKWIVGNDDGEIGYLDLSVSTAFEEQRQWDFQTQLFYNNSKSMIINELELVGLPGRSAVGVNPTIWTSYSYDGETWSNERAISAGTQGDRQKRLIWFQNGFARNTRIQKFRGNSDSHLTVTRLEAQVEALSY